MKVFSANIQDLQTLYISNLQKALDMEQKITKALPDLIGKATDPDLVAAFQSHLLETQEHVTQVESLLERNRSLEKEVLDLLRAGGAEVESEAVSSGGDRVDAVALAAVLDEPGTLTVV